MNANSTFALELSPALLAALRRGDQPAFAATYRLFERPAYTLSMRVLGNAEDASEALHDAFLQAFQRIHSFRGEAPFWAWFRQIVLNVALMRLRQRRSHESLDEFDIEAADGGHASPTPLAAAEAQVLERALAQLPALTRSVLWLFHAEGLTHEEIAQAMGRSASFSKSQLARGTQRLRDLMNVEKESSHV